MRCLWSSGKHHHRSRAPIRECIREPSPVDRLSATTIATKSEPISVRNEGSFFPIMLQRLHVALQHRGASSKPSNSRNAPRFGPAVQALRGVYSLNVSCHPGSSCPQLQDCATNLVGLVHDAWGRIGIDVDRSSYNPVLEKA